MKTIKVSQLKAGDDLGSCVIVSAPVYVGNYCGSKDRAQVTVRYGSGQESTRIWGWNTTVKIKETSDPSGPYAMGPGH